MDVWACGYRLTASAPNSKGWRWDTNATWGGFFFSQPKYQKSLFICWKKNKKKKKTGRETLMSTHQNASDRYGTCQRCGDDDLHHLVEMNRLSDLQKKSTSVYILHTSLIWNSSRLLLLRPVWNPLQLSPNHVRASLRRNQFSVWFHWAQTHTCCIKNNLLRD